MKTTESQIFRLTIRCGDDALAGSGDDGRELARILREIADKVEGGAPWAYQTIRDINGNDVGRYSLKPESYR